MRNEREDLMELIREVLPELSLEKLRQVAAFLARYIRQR